MRSGVRFPLRASNLREGGFIRRGGLRHPSDAPLPAETAETPLRHQVRHPGRSRPATLWVGLTHPALTKLTFMDHLLTMLRNLLRRKLGCDTPPSGRMCASLRRRRPLTIASLPLTLAFVGTRVKSPSQ